MDLFVEASPENAARLIEIYAAFGLKREEMKPALFTTPDNVVRICHEPVRLEVLTGISGVAIARRVEVPVNDLAVPFISYPDSIKKKTSTGHTKDAVDVETPQKRN
jgi:hypothetical protein